ncbi:MAG: TetR/AcrR family transcriptional regulator [Erysipelotrichaceae bacterium]|nr:TetR/AcrR family transcriptional regulator [Erysipelotrichaceae bacterium]
MKDHLQDRILQAAIVQFSRKGLHFTMQDIADTMHIAKKTIYKSYDGKEALLIALIDAGFEKIHAHKQEIIANENLTIPEKLQKEMVALPSDFLGVDWSQLDGLDTMYPRVAQHLKEHLEKNWEPTIDLIEEGISDGVIRPINISILKNIVTASIESFLSNDYLTQNQIAYDDALAEMMDILMKGMQVQDDGTH